MDKAWLLLGASVFGIAARLYTSPISWEQIVRRNDPDTKGIAHCPAYSDFQVAMTSNDFDGDGRPDLITATQKRDCPLDLYYLRNTGTNGFSHPRNFESLPYYPHRPLFMTSGDFDGDGRPDLVVGARDLNGPLQLHYLRNNGGGAFSHPRNFSSIPVTDNGPVEVTCNDFNGDGSLDLMVGVKHSNRGPLNLYQFKNNGHGAFSEGK